MKLSEFVKLPVREAYDYLQDHTKKYRDDQCKRSIHRPLSIDKYKDSKYNWLTNKHEDVMVERRYEYYDVFTDETNFGIEVDDCDYEIVPFIDHVYSLLNSDKNDWDKDGASLCIRKKPKYGEMLYYLFERSSYNSMSFSVCGANGYIRNPIVFLDDEQNENWAIPGIPFKYKEYKPWSMSEPDLSDKEVRTRQESYNESVKIKSCYVYYPELANVYNVKTSKFCMADYGKQVEEYAKTVREHLDWFDNDYADKYPAKIFKKGGYSWSDIKKNTVHDYIAYISLKYMFNDLTWDDFANIAKLHANKTEQADKFFAKCKVERQTSTDDYYDHYSSWGYNNIYENIWNDKTFRLSIVLGLFKKLKDYREIVSSENNYKDRMVCAQVKYKEKLDPISDNYNKEVKDLYDYVNKRIEEIQKTYGKQVKDLNAEIKAEFSEVTDKDIKIKELNFKSSLESFSKRLVSELGKLGTELKVYVPKKNEDTNVSAKFKKLAKKAFEAAPDTDIIILDSYHKCYDAPYEISERDFDDENAELISTLRDEWGSYDADKWVADMMANMPESWISKSDASDIYPGGRVIFYIDSDLEMSTNEEYDN